MNLTVRIHDKEYTKEVAQGITFTEEYNETLDSAVVRLAHIKGQIVKLKPYDDVYIYESSDEEGYFDKHIKEWRSGGKLHDGNEVNANGERIPFYRHLLVDKFSEEVINLSEDIFSYSLELFSETKGLEAIQVPNICVTEPLNVRKKIDIYTYLVRFVNLYSPKYKLGSPDKTWRYEKKYSVAPILKETFKDCYPQDFSLSNPTLKDVLSSLMVTMDMIPYVKDNVIYAKAIAERTGTYDIFEEKASGRISRIVGQMGSSDYCDGVRRQYSNALSQDGVCNFIEYLGFRNRDDSIMTLDNMRLETQHKIYRIKKMNMCWYQAGYVEGLSKPDVYVLRKFDITPLIKLDSEWNALSQDWKQLEKSAPQTIQELSKYKITTLSYSIGGNTITGWSTRYKSYKEFGLDVYDIEHTYIENIIKLLTDMGLYSEVNSGEALYQYYKEKGSILFITEYNRPIYTKKLSFDNEDELYPPKHDGTFETLEDVQKLKTIFFEIEYSGFYDGALTHYRTSGNDNIFANDNVDSALTIVEKDGIAQREKLNRFANKTYVMKGRLENDNYAIDKLLQLGQTGLIGADDDVIIYRREYSIFDNYILVSYAGIQNYVLKSFYTSVFAKYRTNQLASYNESINRSENKSVFLVMSKNIKHNDEEGTFFEIEEPQYNYNNILFQQTMAYVISEVGPDYMRGEERVMFTVQTNLISGSKYIGLFEYNGRECSYVVSIVELYDKNLCKLRFIDWFYNDERGTERVENKLLCSAFYPLEKRKDINSGIIKLHTNKVPYFVEEQTFQSGQMLCFNLAMNDNASGGNYIEKWTAGYEHLWEHPSDNDNYYVGSTQDWYDVVDDDETGAIENMSLQLSHLESNIPLLELNDTNGYNVLDNVYNFLKALPKQISKDEHIILSENIIFPLEHIYKDNKEKINMTLQIIPISDSKDIVIGDYFIKLNDLLLRDEFAKVDEGTISQFVGLLLEDESILNISFNVIKNDNVQSLGGLHAGFSTKDGNRAFIKHMTSFGPNNKQPFTIKIDVITRSDGYEQHPEYDWIPVHLIFNATNIYFIENSEKDGHTHMIIEGSGSLSGAIANLGAGNVDELYKLTTINITNLDFVSSNDDNDVYFDWQSFGVEEPHIYVNIAGEYDFNTKNCVVRPSVVSGSYYPRFNIKDVNKNMFIEFGKETIDKIIAYKILPVKMDDNNEVDNSRFEDFAPKDIFQVISDGDTAESIIRVNTSNVPLGTKSINYWYLDFGTAYQKNYSVNNRTLEKENQYYYEYTPERSGYRFVFGVNITDADIERGYMNIYITKTTHRDTRVFDEDGRQVGVVHNCLDAEGNYVESEGYTYDTPDDKLPIWKVQAPQTTIESVAPIGEELSYVLRIKNLNWFDCKLGVKTKLSVGGVVKKEFDNEFDIDIRETNKITYNSEPIDSATFDVTVETYLLYKNDKSETVTTTKHIDNILIAPEITALYIDPYVDPAGGDSGDRYDVSIAVKNPNNADCSIKFRASLYDADGNVASNNVGGVVAALSEGQVTAGITMAYSTATAEVSFEWKGISSPVTKYVPIVPVISNFAVEADPDRQGAFVASAHISNLNPFDCTIETTIEFDEGGAGATYNFSELVKRNREYYVTQGYEGERGMCFLSAKCVGRDNESKTVSVRKEFG